MDSGALVLETHDLGYSYAPGRFAVRHLSVGLRQGEVLGLLGRNGAGKTTTVRLLTTLLPPTEGTATVLGQDLRTAGRGLRSRLGVVLQSESLDFVTVERNLTLYAFLWGVPRELAKSRAEEMIELFELGPARRRKPWALSGGERRRFQVARELMHDMEILFLDEPTVGLDAIARRRILKYLRERARGGLSIVFTTHILHEADQLCDRIAVLHLGRLIALDSSEELKRQHGGAREVSLTFAAPLSPAHRAELTGELATRGAVAVPLPADAEASGVLAFQARDAEELLPWISAWSHANGLAIDRMSVEAATLEGAFLGMIEETDEDEGEGGTRPAPSAGVPGGDGRVP
ncbi:MAG TPA: ABC transporter ATP-binding protein [Thermoplasmata archaeon]|nr:ABC transporter ATP-binding protein [Thermoplasmata archaeon]